jgi:uncharacterized damage-inducible protein DinB
MDKNQLLSLYEYNYWANHCLLDKAAELDPELWSAPAEVSFGSLRETLTHVLSTEWIWRQRIQAGISPATFPLEIAFPTVDPLREYWLKEEAHMLGHLKSLTHEDFSRTVQYKNTKGASYENPLWQILLHVVNHGTQFRSEAAVILTQFGRSPGDLDYILFLRQKEKIQT